MDSQVCTQNDFYFCPKCASNRIRFVQNRHWVCGECGFDLYINVAAAVGLVLEAEGRILLFSRTREPRKGFLALPGGFVDPDEGIEQACLRECREETGLYIEEISYLASFPNHYAYKGFLYSTCDIFFSAVFKGTAEELLRSVKTVDGEAENCLLLSPQDIDTDRIAFDSTKRALEVWNLNAGTELPGLKPL